VVRRGGCGVLHYYWKVLWTAVVHSADTAQTIIFFLILVAGLAAYFLPAFKPPVDLAGWQVAAIILAAVFLVRVLLAPYWIWQEEHAARLEAEALARVAVQQAEVAKDRSALLAKLRKFYVEGSEIRRVLTPNDVTDDQIDEAEKRSNKWLNDVIVWLKSNMGDAAVSRFTNNGDKPSYGYPLTGNHKEGAAQRRDAMLNALNGCLTNLDTLMQTDRFDQSRQ
jgi:hypothetical protein